MRRLILCILALANSGTIITGQVASKDSLDKTQIIALEHRLANAVAAGDKKTFDALTHKNYVETFDHTQKTKSSILNELRPAPEVKFEYPKLDVELYENAAVVRGIGIYILDTLLNQKIYIAFSDFFIRENYNWKLANSHANTVPAWNAVKLRDDELFDSVIAENCNEESKLKSASYDQPAFIRFKNSTTTRLDITWLNYHGKRERKWTVDAGKSYDMVTFVTHPFIVTGPNEKCHGIYVAVKKPGLVVIK